MLDPTSLRKEFETVAKKLALRNASIDLDWFKGADAERKSVQTELETIQATYNKLSKTIGFLKQSGADFSDEISQVAFLEVQRNKLTARNEKIQEDLKDWLLQLPNVPHETVPIGNSSEENQIVRQWKPQELTPSTLKNFIPKDHTELGINFGLDSEAGAKLSGSRFLVMKGPLARLHRALAQFMLDIQVEQHGYQECYVPYLVHREILIGTGQLPKFEQDLFSARKGGNEEGTETHFLIPTAEVPLTNLFRDSIVLEKTLPIQLVAHTPCFRSEAGSYGRDTRGIIRQHQFDKIELVQLVHPENSYTTLEKMVIHAETILQKLELPYQVVCLCTGDLGFSASKTYDLEVWLPGENAFREIASISNCEAFQSRRIQARFRSSNNKIFLLHTLNGSGLAVGRTLVALLENHQDYSGDIAIPLALQPYIGGITKLSDLGSFTRKA